MTQKDREALRQWEQYRDGSLRAVPVEVNLTPAEIERKRRHLEANPIEWIQYFFPEYAQYDFAPFQRKAILRCIAAPEHFEVLSWARSLAKSTCVMFIVLYLAVTGKKHNVMLASATLDDAKRLLGPYRQQFERNGRLRAFYGDLVNPGQWTDEEFTTKGVTNSCSFRAIGAGSAPRGSRNGAVRPDVLLVDDYDTDASVRNPRIVDQMWEWWEKALYGTRDPSTPTLIIFCGNIIAKDCCVTRAGAKADHWDVVNIRDRQGRSTWPAKNTEEKIDATLSKISTAAQQTEYYNNPIRPGEVFQDLKYGPVPRLSKFQFLIIYSDPAPGERRPGGDLEAQQHQDRGLPGRGGPAAEGGDAGRAVRGDRDAEGTEGRQRDGDLHRGGRQQAERQAQDHRGGPGSRRGERRQHRSQGDGDDAR